MRTTLRPLAILLVAMPIGAAAQSRVTPEALLDFCRAPTIEAARQKGDAIGWPAASERDMEQWRQAAERSGASRIAVLGWQRPDRESGLWFWISSGQNTYRACAFTTREGEGLREALERRFGAPDHGDDSAALRSAFWKRDGSQIAFSSVGEGLRALVHVSIADLP